MSLKSPSIAGEPLPDSWYQRTDTPKLARELLGKYLVVVDPHTGLLSSGRIVETEAYCGREDLACHARGGRKTARTKTMYEAGGIAYVYICYGIHHLFNIITHQDDEPHAVLLRALEPADGLEHMLVRRGMDRPKTALSSGPGSLSKAMGISIEDNAVSMCGPRLWVEDRGGNVLRNEIACGPRVGVKGAGVVAASKPWRFWLAGNRWVSRWVP